MAALVRKVDINKVAMPNTAGVDLALRGASGVILPEVVRQIGSLAAGRAP
jgi:hypothetical protein